MHFMFISNGLCKTISHALSPENQKPLHTEGKGGTASLGLRAKYHGDNIRVLRSPSRAGVGGYNSPSSVPPLTENPWH